VTLRERAGDRTVHGYFEVPDACYDLSTAGWEVIYPHVSYFDSVSLSRIFERADWRVTAGGPLFRGMFRYVEVTTEPGPAWTGDPEALNRQLGAIRGFDARQRAELGRWRETVTGLAAAGAQPVLWGAGSRGVQFLTFADPQRQLHAVVDVNPRKWGRFLPVTGHQVWDPQSLRGGKTSTVVITNPAYSEEIAESVADLGLQAQLLVA
jgi:hypothetical protein